MVNLRNLKINLNFHLSKIKNSDLNIEELEGKLDQKIKQKIDNVLDNVQNLDSDIEI